MAEARNDDYQPPVMGRTRSDSAGVYRLMIPYRPGDMTLSWSLTGYHTRQETYRVQPRRTAPGPHATQHHHENRKRRAGTATHAASAGRRPRTLNRHPDAATTTKPQRRRTRPGKGTGPGRQTP